MNPEPRLSVAVPLFNEEATLSELLRRLREQYEISVQLPDWLEAQTRSNPEQGN